MRPELFQVLGISFYSYRVFLAGAFVICTLLAVRAAERYDGVSLTPVMGIWGLVGALFGARLFYVLQYEGAASWWRALLLWDGGLVFYGGLIGGAVALAINWRLRKIHCLKAADVVAPYLALGEAMVRVGCFLNGCCYGARTNLPWGVQFPPGSVAYQAQLDAGVITPADEWALACHPTELYMTVGLIAVFLMLRYSFFKRSWAGSTACGYLLLYGILRFLVESLRGDSAHSILGMTVSQAISAVLVLCAAAVFIWQIRCASRQVE